MDPMAVMIAKRYRKGEYREEIVGMTRQLRLLFAVVTERGERLRVLSARGAVRDEVREYARR